MPVTAVRFPEVQLNSNQDLSEYFARVHRKESVA